MTNTATPSAALDPGTRARMVEIVDRNHLMRTLGMGLAAPLVGAVLYEHRATWPYWLALGVIALAWPHLVWHLARRSADPLKAEFRNLMLDSVIGGAWVAAMQLNLLPSAMLVAMLTIDRIAVAGWRFYVRTLAALALSCLTTWALLGFPVQLHSTTFGVVMSLPFLFIYTAALGTLVRQLTVRVGSQNRMLERLNRIDALTGLHNRRHWEEAASNELSRFLRTRRPAVVMLIDVDNFKMVNDRHGHASGDRVLCCIADVLRESLREIDIPARYGGDEFAVLLAETDLRNARQVAERVRLLFLERRGQDAEQQHCTLSIGLAEADRLLVTVDDWVRNADAAMYRAKAAGRDRINAA
ncbi:diguanylate cyclase [Luteimonas aquatica]|uniref:diguanylate cyclase n=1 Tax=Luteimonas aquatica TaxID=450364 RepID=UPI001F59BBD6|nr:diguanylate cyclase [Luteimonas aquatica]